MNTAQIKTYIYLLYNKRQYNFSQLPPRWPCAYLFAVTCLTNTQFDLHDATTQQHMIINFFITIKA